MKTGQKEDVNKGIIFWNLPEYIDYRFKTFYK